MSDAPNTLLDSSSGGGVSGHHPPPSDFQFLVAPATSDSFASTSNLARLRLIPIACWRVDDLRFRFDSSIVLPGADKEMKALADLIAAHPKAPLSVFGHADPVGSDDYNKKLSGRRAIAIYAMLIRDASMWDNLYAQPLGNDNWSKDAVDIMYARVHRDDPDGTQPAPSSVHTDSGNRQQLYLQYMDLICGTNLKLTKTAFLGQGADPKGKADYQGCSEFNPLLIFSDERNSELDSSNDKTDRNIANAPNRRVMILLFRDGSRVDTAKWPCPTADQGTAGCIKRFWSDGDQRRSRRLPDEDRVYEDTKDTFACRFYQRLLAKSPCESLPQVPIDVARFVGPGNERSTEIELHICDGSGNVTKKIPAAQADEGIDGYAIYTFDPRVLPNPVLLKWKLPDGEEHLAGPCDPSSVRDSLAKPDVPTADPLIEPTAEPEVTSSVGDPASGGVDPMPEENQWQTLRDVFPSSLA